MGGAVLDINCPNPECDGRSVLYVYRHVYIQVYRYRWMSTIHRCTKRICIFLLIYKFYDLHFLKVILIIIVMNYCDYTDEIEPDIIQLLVTPEMFAKYQQFSFLRYERSLSLSLSLSLLPTLSPLVSFVSQFVCDMYHQPTESGTECEILS